MMFRLLASFLSLAALQAQGALFYASCTSSGSALLTPQAPTASVTLACEQFNPALGQLRYVTSTLTSISAVNGQLTYGNATAEVLTADLVFLLRGQLGPLPNGLVVEWSAPLGPNATSQNPLYPVGETRALQVPMGFHFFDMVRSTSSSLAPFIGTGSYQIPVSFSIGANSTIPPGISVSDYQIGISARGFSSSIASQASDFWLVYGYDEIPEPGSIWLVLGGGVWVLARKLRELGSPAPTRPT